jgi:hypothetical protein
VGPAGWTGNAVDITKGAADALGIRDNSILNYQVLGPDGKPLPLKNTPPVPITANSSNQTRGQQYQRQLDEYYSERQPYAPGIRIATPEQVAKWDYSVQNGLIDPQSVSPEDKLAIAVAKDPQYLIHPENSDLFYHFVTQPLMRTSITDQISSGLAGLPAAGSSLLTGLKDTAQASLESAGEWGKMMWNQFANVKGAQMPVDYGKVGTNMASGIQGVVKGVDDVVNLANGAQAAVYGIARPLIENFVQDPSQRQQIDKNYSDVLQQTLRNQFNSAQQGQNIQQNVAAAYKALGQTTVADALANASPKQDVVDTVSLVANPLNYIPFAEGAAASKAIIPSFFEHALTDGENLGGRIAEAGVAKASAITPEGGLSSFTSKPLPNPIQAADSIGTSDVAKAIGVQGAQATKAESVANQAASDFNGSTALVSKYLQQQEGVGGSAIGRVIQFAGQGVQLAGKGLDALLKAPEVLAQRLVPNSPELASRVGESFRWAAEGGLDALVGEGAKSAIAGFIGGPLAYAGLRFTPDALKNLGEFLSTAGKELTYGKTTLPYWNRVAQETSGLGKGVALALDRPAVYTLGAAAKGSVLGGAIGAGMGALSNPLQPYSGATQGLVQGGILGMVGGGFGQIQSYNSPAEFMARATGDWKRYRDILPSAERANFDKLSSTSQLALSQFNHHFPGLQVDYFNDPNGEWGFHNGSTIGINLANPNGTIKGVLAHEFSHGVAESGMLPDLYRELLGEPATKTPGQYTLLDKNSPDGVAQIDPNTGRYKTTQDFQNLKNQYVQGLADKNIPTSHITDFHIAKEIFAEHGADYALSGQGVIDTHSAFRPGWFSNQYSLKDAAMKLGLAFDRDGNVIHGTGVFRGQELAPNNAINKLLQSYYQQRFDERKIVTSASDEMPDRAFTKKDLITSPNAVDTWFDSTPSVLRDANGVVQKDSTGAPILRKQSDVAKYNAGLTRAVNDYVAALPEDQRAQLGVTQKGEHNNTLRYLPDELLNQMASKNQYNPTQIENLRTLSKSLADRDQAGRMFNFFYQTASRGKQYATLAGAERNVVPYLFETTKDGNVNLKGVDFGQLTNNYLKARQRNDTVKSLWQTPNDFANDASTYFANHAGGKPGAEGVGPDKRDVINALAGIGTSVNKELNPFTSQTPQARSIIKSFRIDRINRLSPTDEIKDFKDERQYISYLNQNYHPGLQSFSEKLPGVEVNTPALRKAQSEYNQNNNEMTGLVRSSFDNPSPDTSARWSQLYGRNKDIESQIGAGAGALATGTKP